jgi:hypothetical protein
VNERPGLTLARPRDVSALFSASLGVLVRNWWSFLAIAAAFVVPVELAISGVGLEQLSSDYDKSPSAGETILPALVSFLVTGPLVTATCVHALESVARGEGPRAGRSILNGLDAFAPVFAAICLAAAGIALGLVALIVPGVYLAVRWYFVPQAVVVEGRRGVAALQRSGELVTDNWWRVAGIVLLANLAATLPALIIQTPLNGVAESADREVVALAGRVVAEVITVPFIALISTLIYWDLRVRREGPTVPSAPGP